MDGNRDVLALLGACLSAAELRRLIGELCADHGDILHVTVMCSQQRPGRMLCVVDLVPKNLDITLCAATLCGRVFGFNSVILDFAPQPGFACGRSFPTGLPTCSCSPRG